MRIKKFFLSVSLYIFSSVLIGAVPNPKVGPLKSYGLACPQGSARGSLSLQMHYGITFISEQTEAVSEQDGVAESKECHVSVEVTPAPSYQMRVDKFIINGWHLTRGQSFTSVNARYGLYDKRGELIGNEIGQFIEPRNEAPQDNVIKAVGFGKEEGPFEIIWQIDEEEWSPCGQPVVLKGDLELSATRQQAPVSAEIALHNANTRFDSHMVWAWSFRKCLPSSSKTLDGKWQSYYYTADGQKVAALLEVRGENGTYKTRYFTGKLFAISYHEDSVSGRWQVGSTLGWFRFDFQGDDQFRGSWGFGEFNTPEKGSWWGKKIEH